MIIAATGHRPDKLGGYDQTTRRALGALAVEHLFAAQPIHVITGMALGWDQAVASACVVLAIPFTAAVPFDGQEDLWPPEAQRRYRNLLGQSERVEVITTPRPVSNRDVVRALQRRNEWMIDRCEAVLALWNGSAGGTFNAIEYADKVGRPVTNLWMDWSLAEDIRDLIG